MRASPYKAITCALNRVCISLHYSNPEAVSNQDHIKFGPGYTLSLTFTLSDHLLIYIQVTDRRVIFPTKVKHLASTVTSRLGYIDSISIILTIPRQQVSTFICDGEIWLLSLYKK